MRCNMKTTSFLASTFMPQRRGILWSHAPGQAMKPDTATVIIDTNEMMKKNLTIPQQEICALLQWPTMFLKSMQPQCSICL